MSNSMILERAIEILNPEHREHYDNIDTVNEACRMGMEAIGYRIPKKPEIITDENLIQGYSVEDKYYVCPCCKNVIGNVKNIDRKREPYINRPAHCDPCGQALDWSDKE